MDETLELQAVSLSSVAGLWLNDSSSEATVTSFIIPPHSISADYSVIHLFSLLGSVSNITTFPKFQCTSSRTVFLCRGCKGYVRFRFKTPVIQHPASHGDQLDDKRNTNRLTLTIAFICTIKIILKGALRDPTWNPHCVCCTKNHIQFSES